MSKSPNHYKGRNGWKPDIISVHITEGGFSGAVSWLCNPASKASAHAVIGANGEKALLVDFKDGSWCNGNSTNSTSRLYYKNSLNPIVRSRATNANYYTYSIEHEGYSYKDRKGALTEAQYKSSLEVMKMMILDMKQTYGVTFIPDRDHLIGHYQIDPKGKPNCPAPNQGKNFPFDRFLADIKEWMKQGGLTQSATPTPADDTSDPKPDKEFAPYLIRITASALNVRKGPGTNYKVVRTLMNDKNVYTIVDESDGPGAKKWGKLKSGVGWISLDHTKKG